MRKNPDLYGAPLVGKHLKCLLKSCIIKLKCGFVCKKRKQIREAAKKILFLVAGPLKEGGGLNGCATKEKLF